MENNLDEKRIVSPEGRRLQAIGLAVVMLLIASANLVLGVETAPAYTDGDFIDSPWWFPTWVLVATCAGVAGYLTRRLSLLWGALTVLPHIVYTHLAITLEWIEDDGLWVVGVAMLIVLGATGALVAEGGKFAANRKLPGKSHGL